MGAHIEVDLKSAAKRRGRRVVIASERTADGATLAAAAGAAPACESARFERMSLIDLWRGAELDERALVLVATNRAPGVATLARWERLARSIALVFVVPRQRIVAWEAIGAARAVGLIAREDLGAATLETAIRALDRARDNERALLSLLAGRHRVLSQLRGVAADLTLTSRDLAARLGPAPGRVARALAQEAILALTDAEARMAEALAEADADRPSDLVALLEALLRPDGREVDPGVYALMSEGPLWVDACPRATNELLRQLLARWRLVRGPGDRLELIVWDAGESARIAVVLTCAASDTPRAALAPVARDLIAHLQPYARACRARVELVSDAGPRAERPSLAIYLAKRRIGPRLARRRSPAVGGDLVDQGG